MKTAFLSIITFLLILTGCDSSSSNNKQEIEAKVKNIITKEIRYDFGKVELINKKKYFELLDNQEDLNLLIDELNNVLYENNVSKQSIDFSKYNVLVYYTKYNAQDQLNEYRENITIEDNIVKIKQQFTGHLKAEEDYFGRAIQIRVYKVEKSLKNIMMIHEDEVSTINLDKLNINDEKRVINFFTKDSYREIEAIKVFDTNSSYQAFLTNEYNSTKLLNKEIDFNKYRVLFVSNIYGSLGHIYQIEELITFPTSSEAKIEHKLIVPKDMYIDGGSSAMESIIRVYKISRDITTVEVKHFEDSVEVDMESGE